MVKADKRIPKRLNRMEAFSDIGTAYPGICFYSSMHDGGLKHIARHYPNATLILMTRDVGDWYRSIKNWNKGYLLGKWIRLCKFGTDRRDEYWKDFYRAHTEKIRQFAKTHLSMNYIEVELNNETTAPLLEKYTGISEDCFTNCRPVPGQPACPSRAPSKEHRLAISTKNITVSVNATDDATPVPTTETKKR
ncbi:hypothetical protein ACHAXT_008160 [Thalassiosira profunda]